MATEVYTTEVIDFAGEEVELRPLPISKMRKFSKIWSDHRKTTNTLLSNMTNKEKERLRAEDGEDVNEYDIANMAQELEDELHEQMMLTLVKLTSLVLESQLRGDKTTKQWTEYLEDNLDQKTATKILFVAGGLKLDGDEDPNLMNQTPTQVAGTN